jgi:hypothetical protein
MRSGVLMARYTAKDHRRQTWMVMTVYVLVMLLVWPYAHRVASVPLKVVFTLMAVTPVVAMIGLMARLVMHSDELEQRVHLFALSVATGIVAALSLIAGFLCAAGVLRLDGDILLWVFPVLCLTYSAARWLFGRRYGGMGCG